ncbi:MAG: hypothetical protein IKN71_05765 [Alphaproteobacteria bacterium]|nr:hypothetical protein [Alphaproteobacteria bacterium]
MSEYDEFRKYEYVEELDFDHGPEMVRREISPAQAIKSGYTVDHAKEFAVWDDICHDGDYLKEKIWDTAQLWGAYMEEEIKNSPDHKLTKRIIDGTESLMYEWNSYYDGWGSGSIPAILATTWKYGEEFAKLNPAALDFKKVKFFRTATDDDARLLNMKFDAEKSKTPKVRAEYLADILREPENLKYLQKLAEKENLSEAEIFGRPLTEIVPTLAFKSEKSAAGMLHILELTEKIMAEKLLRSNEKFAQLRRKIAKEAENKANEVFHKKEAPDSGKRPIKADQINGDAANDMLYNKIYMSKLQDLKAKEPKK